MRKLKDLFSVYRLMVWRIDRIIKRNKKKGISRSNIKLTKKELHYFTYDRNKYSMDMNYYVDVDIDNCSVIIDEM